MSGKKFYNSGRIANVFSHQDRQRLLHHHSMTYKIFVELSEAGYWMKPSLIAEFEAWSDEVEIRMGKKPDSDYSYKVLENCADYGPLTLAEYFEGCARHTRALCESLGAEYNDHLPKI